MQKFNKLKSIPAYLPIVNIDTDMIIPKQFLKTIKRTGLGKNLFFEMRYDDQGKEINDFVLNKDPFNQSKILIAGKNFGCGSSREHAAMEPRHLGIKVVIVKSFARIHETNLKKQGMLALTFDNESDYDKIQEEDTFNFIDLESFSPGNQLSLEIVHKDQSKEIIKLNHTFNSQQIEWYKNGSALNLIKANNL